MSDQSQLCLNMNFKHITQLALEQKLILGSSSPRRKLLLEELGCEFKIISPDIDEIMPENIKPYEGAKLIAEQKAAEVVGYCNSGEIVLGCDTIVVLNEKILGKPKDEAHALATLSLLSGQSHVVCSAIALSQVGGQTFSGYETTEVKFNSVSEQQLIDYISTGEPMDKAGAYGIQGMGAFLVDSIVGNLDNVIGLPRHLLNKLANAMLQEI